MVLPISALYSGIAASVVSSVVSSVGSSEVFYVDDTVASSLTISDDAVVPLLFEYPQHNIKVVAVHNSRNFFSYIKFSMHIESVKL